MQVRLAAAEAARDAVVAELAAVSARIAAEAAELARHASHVAARQAPLVRPNALGRDAAARTEAQLPSRVAATAGGRPAAPASHTGSAAAPPAAGAAAEDDGRGCAVAAGSVAGAALAGAAAEPPGVHLDLPAAGAAPGAEASAGSACTAGRRRQGSPAQQRPSSPAGPAQRQGSLDWTDALFSSFLFDGPPAQQGSPREAGSPAQSTTCHPPSGGGAEPAAQPVRGSAQQAPHQTPRLRCGSGSAGQAQPVPGAGSAGHPPLRAPGPTPAAAPRVPPPAVVRAGPGQRVPHWLPDPQPVGGAARGGGADVTSSSGGAPAAAPLHCSVVSTGVPLPRQHLLREQAHAQVGRRPRSSRTMGCLRTGGGAVQGGELSRVGRYHCGLDRPQGRLRWRTLGCRLCRAAAV